MTSSSSLQEVWFMFCREVRVEWWWGRMKIGMTAEEEMREREVTVLYLTILKMVMIVVMVEIGQINQGRART